MAWKIEPPQPERGEEGAVCRAGGELESGFGGQGFGRCPAGRGGQIQSLLCGGHQR